jgi:hypothetical protein
VYGFDARGLAVEAPGADAGSVSLETGATAASPWTQPRAMLNRLARHPTTHGGWRSLEVKVSRPGVEVRARKGYSALPPGAHVVRPSELPLTVALDGDALPRDVSLRSAAVHLAGAGEERDVLVALKVPLSAATFEPVPGAADAGRASARLSLLARVRDRAGRLVARMSHDTPLEGTGSEVQAIRARSLVSRGRRRNGEKQERSVSLRWSPAGAGGGNRTHTGREPLGILSPARLPVSPLRLRAGLSLPHPPNARAYFGGRRPPRGVVSSGLCASPSSLRVAASSPRRRDGSSGSSGTSKSTGSTGSWACSTPR